MPKVMGKTYFNDNWLTNKEYSKLIKNETTMNFLSIATGVAKNLAFEYR